MLNSNQKFGEFNIQKRVQQRGHINGASRGRSDPAIHATNRPWHTSSAGIKMSVNMVGQTIEGPGPVAKKYLNEMKISEMAQLKGGKNADPSTMDRNGRDSAYGLKKSVASKAMNRVPGADTVARWTKALTDEQANIEIKVGGGVAELPDDNHYKKQYRAIQGQIKKAKKMGPRRHF